VLSVLLTIAALALGQTSRKPTATPVKPGVQARPTLKALAPKATPARPTPMAKSTYKAQAPKSSRISSTRYSRTPVRRSYAPPVQQQPTPERYKEIQQALAAKGYLQNEPTGLWDADSVAALNRFKQDQRQKADGRLDAKALIALGLGPKTDSYISTPGPVEAGTQEQ
jgi:hypothetical protein